MNVKSGRPRIAIDAMGGDHAPEAIVAGALVAHQADYGRMILVGDEAKIRPLLPSSAAGAIDVVHAPLAVAMDESPSAAVRAADGTSLAVAIDLVRDGAADAVVSAGNSGAFLAIALVRLRTIAGIQRPAIAVVLPARHGPVVVLDAGANVDCKPEWLAQFGVMGSAYATSVLGIENPKVGVVSVGEERVKGNALSIEAASLLDLMPINFIGNVEGRDVFENTADVFVCDGFVGNVMLKLSEGVATMIGDVVSSELRGGNAITKLGAKLAEPSLRRIRERLSYDSYGGAPLLGLNGNCIVAHGRANQTAVASAIRAAVAEVDDDTIGRIGTMIRGSNLRPVRHG